MYMVGYNFLNNSATSIKNTFILTEIDFITVKTPKQVRKNNIPIFHTDYVSLPLAPPS